MKKINKIQKILILLMLIIIIIVGIYVLNVFVLEKNTSITEEETITYDYKLYERDNDLYREIFYKLKDLLDKEEINYDDYAEYITELFVIDFYTLNNKTSKSDVGGLQYLYPSIKDNFILNAENTIYKYIGIIKQLPEVSIIESDSIEESTYEINSVEYESYILKLNWSYVNDYDYDTTANFVVIKDNDQLYIVEGSQE
ncbi:MAG TPA: hypothetical protein PLC53_03460 [Bacilli bacterium]|nr:hypothetical protein [Bacilli bacterium]